MIHFLEREEVVDRAVRAGDLIELPTVLGQSPGTVRVIVAQRFFGLSYNQQEQLMQGFRPWCPFCRCALTRIADEPGRLECPSCDADFPEQVDAG